MPSSLSFSLYNSSHSLLKNVSKSDDNDNNNILEYSSECDISSIYSDEVDNDTNNQQSIYLTRQVAAFDNHWIKKSLTNENQFIKQDGTTLLKAERYEKPFLNSNRHQIVSAFLSDHYLVLEL
jgi:hypothetical protein